MSVTVREGQSIPPEMAGALGIMPPQPQPQPAAHVNPHAGWLQPGHAPTGAVIASASAPIGAPQPQPAPHFTAAPQPPQPNGLAAMTALAAGERPRRPVKWFTFPEEVWGDMPDVRPEHRKFAVCRLTVPEEERAQSNMQSGNFMAALGSMACEAVWKVGDVDAGYDFKRGLAVYIGGWWQAIGPVGRRLVETAYVKVNQPSASVGEFMVENAQDGWA